MNSLYSVEVKDCPERPGEGKPRRNLLSPDGQFIATYSAEVRTLFDVLRHAASAFGI